MPSNRPARQIFDIEGHAFFVTFSCYHDVPLLSRDRCKAIVLGQLENLSRRHEAGVVAYVIMPDHVHILLRPSTSGRLSLFVQQWKRLTSFQISTYLQLGSDTTSMPFADRVLDDKGAVHVWQKRYYPFNVYTPRKALEKIEYMHNNPVRAGLVKDPCDWKWSSARYFLKGQSVPVTLVPYDGPLDFKKYYLSKGARSRGWPR